MRGVAMAKNAAIIVLVAAVPSAAQSARAQRVPDYDFDWATIGDVGNEPYLGDSPFGPPYAYGRGSVGYRYRIGRLEVTTGQWMEFVNTFSTQSDEWKFFADPVFWGAEPDPEYDGPGRRWRLRGDVARPEMLPVGSISWREAAMFSNWLHNAKSSDPSSLLNGAYDASTWGDDGRAFTDDPTHLPGARFWIPTLDEWLKAAHYDPDRHGPGEGGWWLYPNRSDEPPIPGVPGEGTTSAGLDLPLTGAWDIPLGAYFDQVSPWGLWDTTGGAREWNEEILPPGYKWDRGICGTEAGGMAYFHHDHVSVVQGLSPGVGANGSGIRIASLVPLPGVPILVLVVTARVLTSRRRRND